MPWKTFDVMDQRTRFVVLAKQQRRNMKQLCREFGIARKTGYKWINRVQEEGLILGVKERSRRPRRIAQKIPKDIEGKFIEIRKKHPTWGARKLISIYAEENKAKRIPSEATVNRIIKRNGLLREEDILNTARKRFERESANELWQMDYKGEFKYGKDGVKCYPLTVLDDHSRYNIGLEAHNRISWIKTKESLEKIFYRYGMPLELLMDHGIAWYATRAKYIPWTQLTVWLMLLGIKITYSGIRHPQTQGKIERYHRTLKYDLIERNNFRSLEEIQRKFNEFREEYNKVRPHEAIDMKTPVKRYVKSNRKYTGKKPQIEYPEGAMIKKLNPCGVMSYKGRQWFISEALAGRKVMLVEKDPEVEVYFINSLVRMLNVKENLTY